MEPETLNIVVIGMGYVGIPCAALLADVPGFRVTGVQRRSERSGWKMEFLNAGNCPFEGKEPGLAELIHRVVVEKGTFRVTDDYSVCKEADVILIDVQTPVDESHIPHYESLRGVSDHLGRCLQPGTLVIIESTVAPGTTQNLVQPILERESGLEAGQGFYLAYSYERVMPGKLLEYITDMPRVVGGVDEESTRRGVALYRHIVRKEITPTDCLTAEMAKAVENAYRDVNIAFANEVALTCERMGVDVYEMRRMINARADRNMHLPGAGVGGHCLPKDPWLLVYGVEKYGGSKTWTPGRSVSRLGLIKLARQINEGMPLHMAHLVEQALSEAQRPLTGARVAVLGVAYLEDSDDTRNTPAVPLIRALLERGAEVIAHDPYVGEREWQLAWDGGTPVPLVREIGIALKDADCAVVVTRHREYVELAESARQQVASGESQISQGNPEELEASALMWMKSLMHMPVLVDGRNVFEAEVCRAAGMIYRGVGRRRRSSTRYSSGASYAPSATGLGSDV